MGIKTATGTYIEYDDVPSNGLYWLRNHTLGQEERILRGKTEKHTFGDLRWRILDLLH